MKIKQYLWIIPFISFISGYILMLHLFYTPDLLIPHLVGKSVHEALPLITQHKLNIRLIDHKEEPALPEGIIINQTPAGGTMVKANQPLFVVTTRKPYVITTPYCIGVSIDQLAKQLNEKNIHPRIYYLSHPYPENICFAQNPTENEPLEKNKLILYVSSGQNKPIIWPNFIGVQLQDVIQILDTYNIQPHIINNSPSKESTHEGLIVIDQRPFAGTLLTLDKNKSLSVQLRVH